MQCTNHLKQMGIAVQNFHGVYDGLPPLVVSYNNYGFFMMILPWVEQQTAWDLIESRKSGTPTSGGDMINTAGRFWNGHGDWPALTAEQKRGLASVSFYYCPSRRSTPTYIDAHHTGPVTDYVIPMLRLNGDGRWTERDDWWNHYRPQPHGSDENGQHFSWHYSRFVGPFRVAITSGPGDGMPGGNSEMEALQWACRDSTTWWRDGTTNQVIIGEKHLRPSEFQRCDGGDANVLDCSYYYSAGGHQEFGVGRHAAAMTRVFARGPNDDPGDPTRHRAFGSGHPGVVNFVIGDGSVRGVNTNTQADNGNGNNVEINSNLSVFTRVVHVSDGYGGTL
jgi:hypothetical protein